MTIRASAATKAELNAEKIRQRQLKQEASDWKQREKALKNKEV